MSEPLEVLVVGCARCGGEHSRHPFRPFREPAGEFTHWSMCPATAEPILLRILTVSPEPAGESR